jgi:hypothetical protein
VSEGDEVEVMARVRGRGNEGEKWHKRLDVDLAIEREITHGLYQKSDAIIFKMVFYLQLLPM